MKKTIPAVSIVIPMYNSEKYIGECLDSILAQTFKDYEVIVVDDCSTDKSRDVVKSYLSKFQRGGVKLNLICSEKNSCGYASIPRNTGLRLSRGEYIMFVDSDDVITKTALEEIYRLAKKFDADVLYCEKYYKTKDSDCSNVSVAWNFEYDFVKKPTLTSENISERIKDFGTKKFWTACWNYLFKRSFLMEKNISFPMLQIGEDELFDFQAICLAKNILRVPNIIYTWRTHENAFSREPLSPEKHIKRWMSSLFKGIGLLDEFMDTLEVCRNNPEYKYIVFEEFILGKMGTMTALYAQFSAHKIDAFIRHELAKVKEKDALTAFLFSRMNIFQVQLIRQGAYIQQLQARLAAK